MIWGRYLIYEVFSSNYFSKKIIRDCQHLFHRNFRYHQFIHSLIEQIIPILKLLIFMLQYQRMVHGISVTQAYATWPREKDILDRDSQDEKWFFWFTLHQIFSNPIWNQYMLFQIFCKNQWCSISPNNLMLIIIPKFLCCPCCICTPQK